jgi:hypothetical protein
VLHPGKAAEAVGNVWMIMHLTQTPVKGIVFHMIRLPVLKDELAFLEKHLPELEQRPELVTLAVEFRKRIAVIRQQIQALQENK